MAGGKTLEGIDILLIDGNNLLYRVSGSADPTALRTLIPRLRNALPSSVATILMLDGRADPGTTHKQRISKGFEVRHSGAASADDSIVWLVQDLVHANRASVLVVSDDIALRNRARQLGAMTQRLEWLERLIELPSGKGGGIGSGPKSAGTPTQLGEDEKDDRQPWRPGRGATTKRGNPRRSPSRKRGPTGPR